MRLAIACLVALGCGSDADSKTDSAGRTATTKPTAARQIPKFHLQRGDSLHTLTTASIRSKTASDIRVDSRSERDLEVLVADGAIVQRARVTYQVDKQKVQFSSGTTEDVASLAGNTYYASWRDGKHHLEREDGAALDTERQVRMLDDIRNFVGQPDFLLEAIGGKPLPKIGAPIPLPAADMGPAVGNEASVKYASARLLEVGRDAALFEEVLVYHAVDRSVPYDVTVMILSRIDLATGHRIKDTVLGAMAWSSMAFDLKGELHYSYSIATR